jgi:hypothetical protein
VEQTCESMDIRRQRRTSGQLTAKSISIKGAKRRSGDGAWKTVPNLYGSPDAARADSEIASRLERACGLPLSINRNAHADRHSIDFPNRLRKCPLLYGEKPWSPDKSQHGKRSKKRYAAPRRWAEGA